MTIDAKVYRYGSVNLDALFKEHDYCFPIHSPDISPCTPMPASFKLFWQGLPCTKFNNDITGDPSLLAHNRTLFVKYLVHPNHSASFPAISIGVSRCGLFMLADCYGGQAYISSLGIKPGDCVLVEADYTKRLVTDSCMMNTLDGGFVVTKFLTNFGKP